MRGVMLFQRERRFDARRSSPPQPPLTSFVLKPKSFLSFLLPPTQTNPYPSCRTTNSILPPKARPPDQGQNLNPSIFLLHPSQSSRPLPLPPSHPPYQAEKKCGPRWNSVYSLRRNPFGKSRRTCSRRRRFRSRNRRV